ncbi:MAG: DUF2715 domain-containing protein [Treponema sp.]
MKKLLVFVFAFAITNSFAEFVMSPSFGYANIYSQFSDIKKAEGSLITGEIKTENKLNHHAFVVGFDLGGYFANGFSLFLNSNFALGGNIKSSTSAKFKVGTGLGSIEKKGKIDLTLKELSGVSWTSQLLLGGTKRFTDEFHLSFLTGLSIGIDFFRFSKIEKDGNSVDISKLVKDNSYISYYTVGMPLQMNLAYYFVKHIGIVFSILDIPSLTIGSPDHFIEVPGGGVNKSSSYKMDFQNMFYLKIGPSFKF